MYSSPGENGFSRDRVTEPGVSWENRCFTVTIFVHFGKVLRSSRSVFTIRTGSCRAAELQHETIPVQRNVTLSSDQFSGEPLYPWQDPDMQAAMLNELRTVPEAGKQRCISCPHDSDDLIAESHIGGLFLGSKNPDRLAKSARSWFLVWQTKIRMLGWASQLRLGAILEPTIQLSCPYRFE